MKKILLVLPLFGLFVFLASNSNGVTAGQALDRTGSPVGTSQCGSCHAGGNYSPTLSILLKNIEGNAVTEYQPDSSYQVEIVFGGNTAPRYGYQAVALLNGSNNNAGTLTTANTNSKIGTLNSRTYADHNGNVSSNTFLLNWTAPAEGSGAVNFYAAGIAANGNGGSSGDSPVTAPSLRINEEGEEEEENPNSIARVGKSPLFSVYPNPADDFIYFENTSGNFKVEIFNAKGQRVKQAEISVNKNYVAISELNKGIYYVQLKTTDNKFHSQKLLKN